MCGLLCESIVGWNSQVGATPGSIGFKMVSIISFLASPNVASTSPPQPPHLLPRWQHVLVYSNHESLCHRHQHRLKMGCILDYVGVTLGRCPLSKTHPLAWQPIWGGHAMVPACGRNDKQSAHR